VTLAQVIQFPPRGDFDPWLNKAQVAAHLCLSVRTVERFVAEQGLPSRMVGGQRRFKLSEVEEWARRKGA